MWRCFSIILCSLGSLGLYAQNWQWTELSSLPFPTSNNAVVEATVNGEEFVYSFGGIDSTKVFSGIHNRCFRYAVSTDTWSEIDTLPAALPRIAMGASNVKGKIYVLGGYHVFANSNEVSSNEVHIYNPQTDNFEGQGSPIPVPIDDHVQCVWRDSLIFVVTGWSNTGNVPKVQIYNPALDTWSLGTETANNYFFTAFGASGYILGDTLYYYGGAGGGSFAARKYLRKGFINPLDPTDITWTQMEDAPGDASYRAACSGTNNTIFWVGGSSVSYNYNGIAYNGSGGVNPSARVLHFNNSVYQFSDEVNQPFGVMDLRGIAKLANGRWIICGGMDSSQVVRNRTFLLENSSVGLGTIEQEVLVLRTKMDAFYIQSPIYSAASLLDVTGREILRFDSDSNFLIPKELLVSGLYLFVQEGKSVRFFCE